VRLGRGTIVVTVLLLCGPALAQVLPIGGAYGNEEGCKAYLTGDFSAESYAVLTPFTFASDAVGCYFAELIEREPGRFTVAASCEGKGERVSHDVLAVVEGSDATGYRVTIGNAGWEQLAQCAGTETLFRRPGTQV
jgi:hypothetical protein